MFETVKLSSKGQFVIPERMRQKLGLATGAALVIREQGEQLVIEKEEQFSATLRHLEEIRERRGQAALAQKQLAKIWENVKDDEEWQRYL